LDGAGEGLFPLYWRPGSQSLGNRQSVRKSVHPTVIKRGVSTRNEGDGIQRRKRVNKEVSVKGEREKKENGLEKKRTKPSDGGQVVRFSESNG